MTPDWYVDPLGRYEGRYFDGERWTAQVKDRGRLVIDPDWDRPIAATTDAAGSNQIGDGQTGENETGAGPSATPEFDTNDHNAVEPISTGAVLVEETPVAAGGMDFSQESPTRQVAVLEAPELAAPELAVVNEQPSTVADGIEVDDDSDSSNRRWLYILGLAILALAVLLILLPRLLGGDDVASTDDTPTNVVSPDDGTEASDAGADEGALPATDPEPDSTDPDSTDPDSTEPESADPVDDNADASGTEAPADTTTAEDPDPTNDTDPGTDDTTDDGTPAVSDQGSDALNVGSLEILNAKPVLRDLAIWHESSLGDRAFTLGPDAGCWLGSIGEAVVQNAHCGPVASTPGAERQFDLIPLRFEDVEDGVIQIRPVTDAVVIDAVLPNGLELIGADGPVDPTTLSPATATTAPTESDAPEGDDTSESDADATDDGAGDDPSESDNDAGDAGEEEPAERGSRGGRAQGD